MRIETQEQFNNLKTSMATVYSAKSVTESFTATVPMSQKLNQAIQDSIDFLSKITLLGVVDSTGEIAQMQIQSSLASRTDTSGDKSREAQLAQNPNGRKYTCKQTNFDVGVLYSTLDIWARYKFLSMYQNAVNRRVGLDRIMIGFYGERAADTTDRVGNPLLQDVNIGWIKLLETNMPSHYLTKGKIAVNKIYMCKDGDFENLDALVYDVGSLIPDAHRTGNEVAIIGRELITNNTGKILAAVGEKPTERQFFNQLEHNYGTYKSYTVPNFPSKGLLVTDTKNLHIYYQNGIVRRQLKDEPKKNRICDYISMNEAYAIADYEAIAGIKAANVEFKLPTSSIEFKLPTY